MYHPDEKKYLNLCRCHRSVPVSAEWPADTETPITVYAKVASQRPSFLLESVEGGERLGRYSFIGLEPLVFFTSHKGVTTIERSGKKERLTGDPFTVVGDLLKEFKTPDIEGMPMFYVGAVGYLGYDLVRHLEKLPDLHRRETGVPDCMLMVPGVVIIIDHVKHTMRLVANTLPAGDGRV